MAKKLFIIYILFVTSLTGVLLLPNKAPVFAHILNDYNNATYFFMVDNNIKINDANVEVIKNGNDFIVKTTASNSFNLKKQLNNIKGESISFKATKIEVLNLLNKMKVNVVFDEKINNLTIYYCYDANLTNCVYVNNQKINIQIAINNDVITMGYPLILNSY